MSKSKSAAFLVKCLMISLSLYSFYRVNEVQRFEYSRPIRKGEKNPDNEFAVKKKNHPQTHATTNKTAHGKVCSRRLPQCRVECLCVLCAEILAYYPFKFSEMTTISQLVSLRCLRYCKKVTSALERFRARSTLASLLRVSESSSVPWVLEHALVSQL